MRTRAVIILVLFIIGLSACNKPDFQDKAPSMPGQDRSVSSKTSMPNILLLVADDIGYEIPTYTGGERYETPHLDSLACSGRLVPGVAVRPHRRWCAHSRAAVQPVQPDLRHRGAHTGCPAAPAATPAPGGAATVGAADSCLRRVPGTGTRS